LRFDEKANAISRITAIPVSPIRICCIRETPPKRPNGPL